MCINDFLPTLTVAAQMNGKDFEQLVVVHGNCPLHKTRIAKFCGFEFVTKRHGWSSSVPDKYKKWSNQRSPCAVGGPRNVQKCSTNIPFIPPNPNLRKTQSWGSLPSPKVQFFFNIVQRVGSNPCSKILLQIFYYSKGLFGNIIWHERLFKGKNVSNWG